MPQHQEMPHLHHPSLIYKEQRAPLSLQSEESQLQRDTVFVCLKTRVQASLQSIPAEGKDGNRTTTLFLDF